MGRKSIMVYCPKCSQIGSLRFKDSKSNKLVITHYSNRLYKSGKSGTYFHYIGVLNDKTIKVLTELWLVHGKKHHKNASKLKEEFRFGDMLRELRKTLLSKNIPVDKSDLVNYDVDVAMNAFNSLYNIHQLKLKESAKNIYIFLRRRPHCYKEILIESTISGKMFSSKAKFVLSKAFQTLT